MSNGGIDGFDWLQSFLPADSQPDYDPNASNNGAYQTHPAFQDAEEVAKAAFMHQQAHRSYSFMRSTNPGPNHALNSSQVASRASSGQHRGNQHQQASSVYSQQLTHPPPESSPHQPDRSRQLDPRQSSSVPSPYNPAAQAHQDAYRRPVEQNAQTPMAPIRSPRGPSTSMRNSSEVGQSFHTANETTRPTAPAQRMNSTTARAMSTPQSPYQPYSAIADRHSQWPAQSHASQGASRPAAPVQRTHTPAARPPVSQTSYDQFEVSPHNVQGSAHSTAAQGARPTPLGQRTHTPAGSTQASQSPQQSRSVISCDNVQRLPQSARPTPPVQRTNTPAGSTQASQSPQQSRSTISPQNVQRLPQSARPTPPVQMTHTPVGGTQVSHSLHRTHSMIPIQNTQQLSSSAAAQLSWPASPVHRTHTPITRIQESQNTHQRHSATPTQGVQRSSQSHAPPNHHTSVDAGSYPPLASPKGFQSSAAPSTVGSPQLTSPAIGTSEVSNTSTLNLATNDVRSKPTSSGTDLAHVQSAIPAAPNRVNSPATCQPASTNSPPVSSAPAPISTHTVPPAQTAVALHNSEERRPREEGRSQGKPPSTSSYQEPKQTSRQPLISQSNEQSTPAVSSTHVPNPPLTFSHSRFCYTSPYDTGSGTSSASNKTTARNSQSKVYPLPGASHSQTKRWLPTQDYPTGPMPPTKMQRLDNTQSQPVIIQNASSTWSSASPMPAVQPSVEQTRSRGPGKILKNREHLIQPIRRSDALLKESYDPATIARDVLIAAGKHPTEKHLNHHLDALRRNFTKIDYFSDLATFRWDMVDVKYEPRTTRMPPVSTFQPPHPPDSHSLHQPQPFTRDPAPPRDHVTIRAPSQHVPSRDTPPNRQVAPPAPVRIDARPHPGGLSAWGTLPFKPPAYHSPQRAFPLNLPSGLPRIGPEPALLKSSHEPALFPTPPQPQQRQTTTNAPAPNPPPPAKQVITKSTSKPKPQGPTTKSQSDSSRAAQSPEARRLPQPQVVIPPSPDKMPTKRRPGRPPKSISNHIEVAIPRELPVHYQVFPCKWEECAAELHNIDSVRAHVLKVHIPHSLFCLWKDCDNKTPMAAAKMFEHVVNDHISKMAWALGDGPTVPVTAETDLTHPSDLGDQSARKGTMVLPVDEHQIKAFSKAHGKATEKMKAQALLEAGRHWKQQIGPEMDWSDRRLLTPARQSRVHCGEMAFVAED